MEKQSITLNINSLLKQFPLSFGVLLLSCFFYRILPSIWEPHANSPVRSDPELTPKVAAHSEGVNFQRATVPLSLRKISSIPSVSLNIFCLLF